MGCPTLLAALAALAALTALVRAADRWLHARWIAPWLLLVAAGAHAHTGDATALASVQIKANEVLYTYTPTASSSANAAALPTLLRQHLSVRSGDQPCPANAGDDLTVVFSCPASVTSLSVTDNLPTVLGEQHHVMAVFFWPGGSASHAFDRQAPTARVSVSEASSASTARTGFFVLGIEHILTGYDHLLFLLALILCGGRFVSQLKIITAFTVAHSLTLGAAVLGVISLPSLLVESLIALSIAYVGFENLSPRHALARRWLISFAFGLIHGFGFSSVLQEIGLPPDRLLWSLFNFNLGVETGQLAAVLLVMPLLLWLRHQAWQTQLVRLLSTLVLATGLVLFVLRLAEGLG